VICILKEPQQTDNDNKTKLILIIIIIVQQVQNKIEIVQKVESFVLYLLVFLSDRSAYVMSY